MKVDYFNNVNNNSFDDIFKMPNNKTFVLLVLYILCLFSIIKMKPMLLGIVVLTYVAYLMYYRHVSDSTDKVDYEQLFKLSTLIIVVLFFSTGLLRK